MLAVIGPIFCTAALTSPVTALTAGEFKKLCAAGKSACTDNPIATAYIGGSLDLIATLDEQTDYLDQIYCRKPAEFFDVQKIIETILASDATFDDANTMRLVVKFLEQHGGCTNRDN